MRVTDEMADVVARQRFHRAHPYTKADTWTWMPFNAKRPWLEDARADLQLALAAAPALPPETIETAMLRAMRAAALCDRHKRPETLGEEMLCDACNRFALRAALIAGATEEALT